MIKGSLWPLFEEKSSGKSRVEISKLVKGCFNSLEEEMLPWSQVVTVEVVRSGHILHTDI